MNATELSQKQSLPYEAKIIHAILRAREFYDHTDGMVYCSVGGLDSLTLLYFLRRNVSKKIVGVSVSSLEDKSVQAIHRQLDNFIVLTPSISKVEVIEKYGYPILSKDSAKKIETLQNPTPRNESSRRAAMTGQRNGYFSKKDMLSKKWQRLFAGLENDFYKTDYQVAPFRVSDKCCYHLKEKPLQQYAKAAKLFPYTGLMASEGGRREKAIKINGCNYYGETTKRSCPFGIFTRQDLLHLAVDLNVPVPAIYGEIKQDENGNYHTTKAQRTGCNMCGFGIHLEKRPHRFDLLREENPREWHFWMHDMGWGAVLDYIGVAWEDEFPAAKVN